MPSPIRVGLIRCDTHGMWYGPMMARHDPFKFQRPTKDLKNRRYTWQTGGNHLFMYTDYRDRSHMTVPFVEGFQIVKLWDVDRTAAEQAADVLLGVPVVCRSPDECSDNVDLVFVADCDFDGSDHLELATPGLEKGVPTFVDKPFANTVENCRKMIELARKANTPIFSASILRFEPAFAQFRSRLSEIEGVNFATFSGYGVEPAGLVHTISVTQLMFGAGISTVQVMETPKQTAVWLDYDNNPRAPKHGVMIHTQLGKRPFTSLGASVYGTKTDLSTLVMGDFQYPWGTAQIIKTIKRMVETKQTPGELDDMVEAIAVIESFRRSRSTGEAARVSDFL